MTNKRGRKSTAELSVISHAPGQRPEPPKALTKEQAETWRQIVATKPSDWFARDTHELLISYCKHVSIVRALDGQIDAFDSSEMASKEGVIRYRELTNMREKHTRALTALSRSMRLTHQSKYRAETAARRETGAARKPWAN